MTRRIVPATWAALLALVLCLPAMGAELSVNKPGGNGKGGKGGGGGKGDNCGTCAGVITEMTLRYTGRAAGAEVRVIQKERSQTIVLFEGTVEPDGEFQIEGGNRNGDLSPVIHIFVNGKMNTPIPTNCAGLFGEGLKRGDFEVVEVTSSQGGKVCPDDDDDGEGGGDDDGEGGGDDDGEECCEGQVNALTLRYNGTETVSVKITQRVGSRQVKVFEDSSVEAGDEIEIEGKNDRGTFGSKIQVFVDGRLYATLHTSCSEPIGPGLVARDFEVTGGTSRNGGDLCPVDPDDDGEPGTCSACEGQVSELTLRYLGTEEAVIRVLQKDRKQKNVEVFKGTVQPGATFTIEGANRKGTFGPALRVQIDGRLNTSIHTSCSQPIGPGFTAGLFEVVEGFSREGGRLCEVEQE